MAGKQKTKPRQRRFSPEVRRQMILDAARDLFRDKPNATVDDLATKAGVTRQLIGQYFPGGGLEMIHQELMQKAFNTLVDQVLKTDYPPPKSLKEWRETIPLTTARQFEWGVGLGMPWLFAAEGSGLPAEMGMARVNMRIGVVPLIMEWSAAVLPDTPENRILVQIGYRAIDELVWLVATDKLALEEGVRIAVALWEGIVERSAKLLAAS